VSTKGSKKGRPPNSSQYPEDRKLLGRVYELHKEGMPVTTAVKHVVAEMEWTPLQKNQAIERLRKEKFKKFRAEKEEALHATRPTPQSRHSPLAQMADQARQAVKFLGPSGIKAVKEHERRVRENKDTIREAVETARSLRKSQT
jgi:hypothetical protein